MVAISHPELRPEGGAKISQYSQRQADVVDLVGNELRSLSVAELLEGEEDPDLHLWVSLMQGDELINPPSPFIGGPPADGR